jgi:hypothetical protein
MEITLPEAVTLVEFPNKIRFKGKQNVLSDFVEEFRRISKLSNGQLCKFDEYTFKVSDLITDDSLKQNWIEMPNHAWNIMTSKFHDVLNEYDDNPLDFNDCGYLNPKLPFDIGIEVTDLPISDLYLFGNSFSEIRLNPCEKMFLLLKEDIFEKISPMIINSQKLKVDFFLKEKSNDSIVYKLFFKNETTLEQITDELEKLTPYFKN